MPSDRAARLANEVERTDTENQLSLTALNARPLVRTVKVVEEESAVAQDAVDFRRLEISGSQVLIGLLLGLCLVWLFVAGIVHFYLFAR